MTSTLDHTTIVKNRLAHPDGAPMTGIPVELIVRASSTWAADGKGRIVGKAHTWTDQGGCWRQAMLPYTAYRDEYVYVEVKEGGYRTGFIRVPPPIEGAERWVYELLTEPPTPTPPPVPPVIRLRQLHDVQVTEPVNGDTLVYRDGTWLNAPVAAKLAQLLDVDGQAIIDAPDGATLVKRNGTWTAETPLMRTLADIDESVTWAEQDDVLTYLSDTQGWGVTRGKPPTIVASWDYHPNDPYTVLVAVDAFDQSKDLFIAWGDSGSNTPVPEPEVYEHVYTTDGDYVLWLFYSDESEAISFDVPIPQPPQGG